MVTQSKLTSWAQAMGPGPLESDTYLIVGGLFTKPLRPPPSCHLIVRQAAEAVATDSCKRLVDYFVETCHQISEGFKAPYIPTLVPD